MLTRLYTPADIGVFALYLALANLAGVVAGLRYDQAVVLPRRKAMARSVARLAIGLTMISSIILAAMVVLAGSKLSTLFGTPALAGVLWLLPVAVLGRGTLQTLMSWSTRQQLFADVAAGRVAQQLGAAAVQVGVAFLTMGGALALAGGHVAGLILSVATLSARAGRTLWYGTPARRRSLAVILAARRHRDFARFDVGAALLNTAALEIPILLTGVFFAPEVVGGLGLAMRIAGLPATLAVAAYGQVFYERAARNQRDGGTATAALRDTLRPVLLLAVLPYVLLAVAGPSIFVILFGESWRLAGLYASVLAPLFFLMALVGPISQLYFVFGRQRRLLLFQGWFFTAGAIGIGLGGVLNAPLAGVIAFSVLGSLRHLTMLFDLLRISGANNKPPQRAAP